MPSRDDEDEKFGSSIDEFDRRKFLGAVTSAGIAGVAGCTGGVGSGGGSGHQQVQRKDVRMVTAWPATESWTEHHYNPFNPGLDMVDTHDPGNIIFDHLGVWGSNTNEFVPLIIDEWSFNENQGEHGAVEFSIVDDYYWHDGTNLTTESIELQYNLILRFNEIVNPDSPPHPQIESVEQVDERNMRIFLRTELGEQFLAQSTMWMESPLGCGIMMKPDAGSGDWTWREWYEALNEAEGQEATDLATELSQWRYAPQDVIGNGPFQHSEVSDREIVYEIFEDHPNAENLNFTEISYQQHEDPVLAFINQQVDRIHALLPVEPGLQPQVPDYHVIQGDHVSNHRITYNHGNFDAPESPGTGAYEPVTADRNVRKALSYIVQKELIATNIGGQYNAFEYPPVQIPHELIGTEDAPISIDFAEDYTTNRVENAQSHLEAAGFVEENGQWVDEETSEQMTLRLFVDSTSDVALPFAQTIQSQWDQFGISVELNAVDAATFGSGRHDGEFDVIHDATSAFSVYKMWSVANLDWYNSLFHGGAEFEVPSEIGNPDSELETVNIYDLHSEWRQTGSTDILRQMVWTWNQALFFHEVAWGAEYDGIRADLWDVGTDDRAIRHTESAYPYPMKVRGTEGYIALHD